MTVEGRSYGGLSAEQRSQERRHRLLEAARAVIADSGVATLTVDLVCQHANLSKRYFYTEFSSKDDILDACVEELYSELYAGIDEIVVTAPLMERISGALRVVVRALTSSPSAARLYMESPGFPRLRERQQRAVHEVTERMVVNGMPFRGEPKHSVDRVLATRALVTAATELIIAWLHGDIDTDEDTLVATITAISIGAAATI